MSLQHRRSHFAYLSIIDNHGPGRWLQSSEMLVDFVDITIRSLFDPAYRTNKLTIILIEGVEHPRIEDIPSSRHTWRAKVCFHDRVVCRIKFENHHIARIGSEIMGNVCMWTRLGSDLDSMCHAAGRCRRGGGESGSH